MCRSKNIRRGDGAENALQRQPRQASQGPAPDQRTFEKGAGRGSNLGNHVLHSGSRMLCGKSPIAPRSQRVVVLVRYDRRSDRRLWKFWCATIGGAIGDFGSSGVLRSAERSATMVVMRCKRDRRGRDQRIYGALPTELRRAVEVGGQSRSACDLGLCDQRPVTKLRRWDSNPTTPGSLSMYSESAVDRVRWLFQ